MLRARPRRRCDRNGMVDAAHNASRVYMPAVCVKCRYPTDLSICTPGEAVICPECGRQQMPVNMSRSAYERWVFIAPAFKMFLVGHVCMSLAALFACVFGIVFVTASSFFDVVAILLQLIALLVFLPMVAWLRPFRPSWLWLMIVIGWFATMFGCLIWAMSGLVVRPYHPPYAFVAFMMVGLICIQLIPWHVSMWHPEREVAVRIHRACRYAIGFLVLCPWSFLVLWFVMTVDQREYWLVPYGYFACLLGIAFVVAPALMLSAESRNWEELIELGSDAGCPASAQLKQDQEPA